MNESVRLLASCVHVSELIPLHCFLSVLFKLLKTKNEKDFIVIVFDCRICIL